MRFRRFSGRKILFARKSRALNVQRSNFEFQFFANVGEPAEIVLFKISEQSSPLPDLLIQTFSRRKVFLMRAQMFRKQGNFRG